MKSKRELFLVQDFDIGDIVVITDNIAGMTKGDVGIITDKLEEHGLIEIMLKNKRTYNMLPQWLEHYQI